jgi:hypothetical protein
MLDTKYRCEVVLPLFRNEALETLNGLRFYLRTLEEFIDREREQEISGLKQHAEQWEAVHQEDFWAWHYPVHWEQIFASQLRSSFVVTLMSLAESHVRTVVEQACAIAGSPISRDELHHSPLEQQRSRLRKRAGFTRPDDKSWASLYDIRAIRNCIVHADGAIYADKKPDRLRSLISTIPGISTPHDMIELSPEFPVHGLTTVEEFLTVLYEEASALCQRVGHP